MEPLFYAQPIGNEDKPGTEQKRNFLRPDDAAIEDISQDDIEKDNQHHGDDNQLGEFNQHNMEKIDCPENQVFHD